MNGKGASFGEFENTEEYKWLKDNAHKFGFRKELSIHLPYDPEIKILNIYSKKMKMHAYTKPCAHIFIAAFLIIAKKLGEK